MKGGKTNKRSTRDFRAKKSLGQHFLTDEHLASKIVNLFLERNKAGAILEIGPGKGMLTKYLLKKSELKFFAVELDGRMALLLKQQFPKLEPNLFEADILQFDFERIPEMEFSVIGNFPYNISSQILFTLLNFRHRVPLISGMFQREVAQRISSKHANKSYGIISVLLQSFYHCEYLFELGPASFQPPPKVTSAVVQLIRKEKQPFIEDESFFFRLVKAGFGKRRKTLRNCLKEFSIEKKLLGETVFNQRAEQLSVEEWINLSNHIYERNQ